MKQLIQLLIRSLNVILFKNNLPNHIAIYLHKTSYETVQLLNEIITLFKYLGYRFVTIDEFNKQIENKETKICSISFDDGFKNWKNLIDLFDREKIKATFFVNSILFTQDNKKEYLKRLDPSGEISEEDLLDEKSLRKLINSGHEIGAHTHNHFYMNKKTIDDIKLDISMNKKIFEELNITATSFAIPFGMKRYINNEQIDYLKSKYNIICFGEPGMQFYQKNGLLERSPWVESKNIYFNLVNLSTDTKLFNTFFKRSGLG